MHIHSPECQHHGHEVAIDLATEHTYSFFKNHLQKNSKILEVGCGLGHLGSRLIKEGFLLRAIDSSNEVCELAKARGFPAENLDFFDLGDEKFDSILFTRSLHHIEPLSGAMEKVKTLLAPNGILIIEDFDYLLPNLNDLTWFYQKLDSMSDQSVHPFVDMSDCLGRWLSHHEEDHSISSGSKILRQVNLNFEIEWIGRAAYFYRYFVRELKNDFSKAKEFLELENDLITQDKINAVGVRIVARLK